MPEFFLPSNPRDTRLQTTTLLMVFSFFGICELWLGRWENFFLVMLIFGATLLGLKQIKNAPALAKITDTTLIFHTPHYQTKQTITLSLTEITAIQFVGPKERRYLRYQLKDGINHDFGPYQLSDELEQQLFNWLENNLPNNILLTVRPHASYFESVRVEY